MAKLDAYFGEYGGQYVPQILVPALDQLEQAFIDADIPYMITDGTDYDADIGRFVQSHGRSGIPLYVMYPRGSGSQPVILPQLLTRDIVLTAIEKAR